MQVRLPGQHLGTLPKLLPEVAQCCWCPQGLFVLEDLQGWGEAGCVPAWGRCEAALAPQAKSRAQSVCVDKVLLETASTFTDMPPTVVSL